MKHILIIESDAKLVSELKLALEKAGYSVDKAANLRGGLKKMVKSRPNLVIAALKLPKAGRENPLLPIREVTSAPLIILGSEDEAPMMLEFGADAYLPIPPQVKELLARVRALLRRYSASASSEKRSLSGSSAAM